MNPRCAARRMLWVMACALGLAHAAAGASVAPAPRTETVVRCGWFDNPSPGNVTLTDGQAQWLIGMQGGFQADGDWPEFAASRWVATNRSYGYGCVCLRVLDQPATQRILRILGGHSRPLAACLKEAALPRRDPAADRQAP